MRSWRSSSERVERLRAELGPGPWARDRLLGLGFSARQLERDVAAGRLVRLRPGLYDHAAPLRPAEPRSGSADGALAPALLVRYGADAALSHETAAGTRGIWLPLPCDERVQVTVPGAKVRGDALVRVHGSPLAPDEVDLVAGVRMTSVPRTAVDLARGRSFAQALVPLDSAVRLLLVGRLPAFEARRVLADPHVGVQIDAARDQLRRATERQAGWRGIGVVRGCLAHVDPRSESPYESWSRGVLMGAGLVPEAVGLEVFGASGRRYVADLAWPESRVIVEIDGLTKYGTDPRTVRERLQAERHRHADLEDAGWTVVRWNAGEPADRVVARVQRALAR